MAQTGDRTGTGTGGDSVYKFLYGEQARLFADEIHPDLRHSKTGTLAMASAGENCNASQFYFTLRDDIDYLDGKHTVFGVVEEQEGLDTLAKINESLVDDVGRPFKDIRIKHTYILDDPFDDPPQLAEYIPEMSPEGKPHDETAEERLEDSWVPLDEKLAPHELDEMIRVKEAHTNAAILESIGDIPDAEMKPPDNVLFVCKLNPVTQDEDLFTIFSRFGTVTSADIIRDYKTGDSLCYAFIEFEAKEACERAFFKMDNTLIDDRRIHVDFSQSVAKLWGQYRHSKGSHPKGGCFKCGSTDHIARDCEQGSNNKQQGPKYVLKDDQIQHGGDGHKRYDMVFDENQQENRGAAGKEGTKKQKTDHRRSEDSSHHRHRYDDEKNVRHGREYERRKNESGSYDRHHDKNGAAEGRSETREPRDSRRSSDSSRHEKDEGDHGRRSKRDDEDRRRRSESHEKDERDYRRRSETDRHQREDYHRRKSRDRHDDDHRK